MEGSASRVKSQSSGKKDIEFCFADGKAAEGDGPESGIHNDTEPLWAGSIQIVNNLVEKADKFLFCTWEEAR